MNEEGFYRSTTTFKTSVQNLREKVNGVVAGSEALTLEEGPLALWTARAKGRHRRPSCRVRSPRELPDQPIGSANAAEWRPVRTKWFGRHEPAQTFFHA